MVKTSLRLVEAMQENQREPDVTSSGVTSADTDAESGDEGVTDLDRDLRALKAMYDRGLIPQDAYEKRCANLIRNHNDK